MRTAHDAALHVSFYVRDVHHVHIRWTVEEHMRTCKSTALHSAAHSLRNEYIASMHKRHRRPHQRDNEDDDDVVALSSTFGPDASEMGLSMQKRRRTSSFESTSTAGPTPTTLSRSAERGDGGWRGDGWDDGSVVGRQHGWPENGGNQAWRDDGQGWGGVERPRDQAWDRAGRGGWGNGHASGWEKNDTVDIQLRHHNEQQKERMASERDRGREQRETERTKRRGEQERVKERERKDTPAERKAVKEGKEEIHKEDDPKDHLIASLRSALQETSAECDRWRSLFPPHQLKEEGKEETSMSCAYACSIFFVLVKVALC